MPSESTTSTPTPERQGWQLSSTVRETERVGCTAGEAYGRAESRAQTLARLLRRQARRHFGGDDANGLQLLLAIELGWASEVMLDLGERLLTADSWSTWLAGVVAPPPAAGIPDYARDYQIDLEPTTPSLDNLAAMSDRRTGEEVLVLLRMQKIRDPELDRHQYEEWKRLTLLHGKSVQIVVILMWPQADDPSITGSYQGVDEKSLPVEFSYHIDRAWERDTDQALKNVGVLTMAPLTRGARERMPYIVATIARRIKDRVHDPEMVEALWTSVYWNMGITCTLEEAHAALGPHLDRIHGFKLYKDALASCFHAAYAKASEEEAITAARDLVQRQARRRFGADAAAEAQLATVANVNELAALSNRLLTVANWGELLAKAP